MTVEEIHVRLRGLGNEQAAAMAIRRKNRRGWLLAYAGNFVAIELLQARVQHGELRVEQVDAIQVIRKLAAGKVRESELANWIRTHLQRAKKN